MIEEKEMLSANNRLREQEIFDIAERAMQDKNENEKQWRKIYLTNLFVSNMLRNKIEHEMEKFRVVEMAFKQIKTATVYH